MEGEKLKQLADSLTRDTNRIFEKGVKGRNAKIIASNNRVLKSTNQTIVAVNSAIEKRNQELEVIDKLAQEQERLVGIEKKLSRAKAPKSIERWTKAQENSRKKIESLERGVESATYARARAEMVAAATSRDLMASQLAGVEVKKKQRQADADAAKETKKLTSVQDKAKNALKSYTTGAKQNSDALGRVIKAHKATIDSSKSMRKTFNTARDSVKAYRKEHQKLIDMMSDPKTTSSALDSQYTRASKAYLALERNVRNATESVGELDKLTSVQDRAAASLVDYTKSVKDHEDLLNRELATNKHAIDSNKKLQGVFDRAKESVITYHQEHKKLADMMDSGTASSSAMESQVNRVGGAYRSMDRNIRNATDSLRTHLVEESKSALRSPFGRGGRKAPDIEGSLARNLGALTPLGTVSPGLLLPLGAAFMAVAQGVVAASQSLLALPAALAAGAAGFGVFKMATLGLADAFTALVDYNNPDKFAESLRLLSPAAQQFMLSIQQLIPTFRELKNAVQDTFFAGLPQVVNGLVKTYRDSFGNMAVGVAGAFNGIFKQIGSVLQDPRAQQSVAVMFDGIVKSFQALTPLVGSLTQVFLQLSSVGAQVLPSIVQDVANLVAQFSSFIDKAAASGELKKWMTEGWEALKAVGSVIVYAGKMLYEVFGLHGPEDIQRFKATLFGVVDGFGVFFGTLEKFFHGLVTVFNSITSSGIGQFVSAIVDKIGGIEAVLSVLAGGLLFIKIGASFYKLFKLIEDGLAFLSLKVVALRGGLAALPAAAGTAGTAAGAAAGAGLAGAGAAAGTGFASKVKTVLKGAGWVGVGLSIADAIGEGLRDGAGGWRDALADGFDPGKVLNPDWILEKIFGKPTPKHGGTYWPSGPPGPPGSPGGGGTPDTPWGDTVYGSNGQPYRPVPPGTPGAVPIPGKNRWGVPGTPGSTPSGSREPGSRWGEIPDIPAGGFPVPTPNPGGGPTPNIPYGQYSLQNIPLGQFSGSQWAAPDPRSMVSQLTPHQIAQGNTKGYGYVVDPQQVFDKESALQQQRAAVEEARARVLELAQDNQATEQAKLKAQNDIVQAERTFIKTQVELLEAQRGTWKKINESIKDQTKMLDGLGAEIDADFGISKGLPGIAENLTKFLANITAAPVYGALAGVRGAGGDLGGGKGLIGAAALSGAFGPQFMQPDSSTPAPPAPTVTAPSAALPGAAIPGATTPSIPATSAETPGSPNPFAGIRPSLNPKNVSTAGLQPQSMALLSLIQGMPQFAGIPLTSAVLTRENDPFPWHPSGRGLDLGLDATDPVQSALGDQLNAFLNANKDMFGIYNTLWKVKDHFNHLHIALKEGASPLMNNPALKGLMPPGTGGAVTDLKPSLTSGGIPIPLPVTIVGGTGTAGLPTAGSPAGTPGITPPAGTPNGPAPATNTPLPIPPAGTPGGKPGSTGSMKDEAVTKVWTVEPDGSISWRSSYGNPTAAPKGQPGRPATAPPAAAAGPLPANLPSPGQGMPMPWTLPPLAPTPGAGPTQIGATVAPPEGTGDGFGGFSGGILGAAQAAAGAAGAMSGGGAAAGALAQMGIEELNRAIAFAGQAAGIGVSGLMETFLPTGGSELANNNWLTKIAGGIVGMKPLLPNFANVSGAANDVQQAQNSGNPQGGTANVNVTQNNYEQNGNSATSDLERLANKAAGASMPAMGAGR